MRGIIRGPFAEGAIAIEHEAIPNFMPAMTMPFYVEERDVAGLMPGDPVEFEFRVGKETSRATRFRKLERAESAPPKANATGIGQATVPNAAGPRRLREGDVVPAFSLLDQDERVLDESALRNRYTVVTFVFTRCPVPEFCPLLATKFAQLQSALRERANLPTSEVQLLGVTIDPAHDRPAVLREYAKSVGADPQRWRFATGTEAEIEKLTRLFAVRAERNGASLDHTLATALIGPDGKIVGIWRGNAWQPDEILSRIAAGKSG